MFSRSYKFNNSQFTIVFGNILNTNAEVVVSSDDSYISMGGGVSAAILKKCGPQVQIDAKRKMPLSLGDVAISTAGDWDKKFIFHAITIDLDSDIFKSKEEYLSDISKKHNIEIEEICKYIISKSTKRCLDIINTLGISSIAFPTIGAGHAGLELQKVVCFIIDEIATFLSNTNKIFNIELYIFDNRDVESMLDIFEHTAILTSKSSVIKKESILIDVPNDFIPEKSESMDHDIFISYSRKDSEKVDRICKILDTHNIKYWMDRNGYYSGTNYKATIIDAISKAKLVVFISSENSNASVNVYNEIQEAIGQKKKLLPIKIDNAPYSKEINFDLRNVDYIEYSRSDNFIPKVINNIKLLLIE